MLDKKIYGFTRGIVIKNNDPESRGRVKIFLPQYSNYILNGSYSLNKIGEKTISSQAKSFLESNPTSSSQIPTVIIEQIAEIVPWADQAAPLIGGGGMGVFNAKTNTYTASDATLSGGIFPSAFNKEVRLNLTPDPKTEGTTNINTHLEQSMHALAAARGSFSVPKVGSHVWVFFEDGNIASPKYFAYSYNSEEWGSVMQGSPKNPSLTQGVLPVESDPRSPSLYAGKYVLSERGGTLEINSTQGSEGIKMGDIHGNSYQTSPYGIFETVAKRQKTTDVNGDYFIKVRGNYKVEVGGDCQIIAKGTTHHVAGDLKDVKHQKEWLKTAAPAFQNAAKPIAQPNFEKVRKQNAKVAEKKAPNDSFCLPFSLKFKLPFGLPFSVWLKQLNLMLQTVGKYLDMGLLMLKAVQEIVSEVLNLIRNPFAFLFAMLGDQIKLLGIKLCNNKNKK